MKMQLMMRLVLYCGDVLSRPRKEKVMSFHGASHEKVMSLYFLQLRFENIKVMARAILKYRSNYSLLYFKIQSI